MAEHLTYTYQEGPVTPEQKAQDFVEHDRTYKLFMTMTKWTIGSIVVILLLMYAFLVA